MSTRRIVARSAGQQHGFIRRMVSPGDLGRLMKPFVFLDHVHGAVAPGTGFGWHPHSGIATLTYSLNSDTAYEDTTGQKGIIEATGLEWMRAGGGTWHQGALHRCEAPVTAFQLWVALPPGIEDGPPEGIYVAPNDVPQVGNVRVLLGEYGGRANPIPPPSPIVYLDVVLAAGETWTFTPPDGYDVAWAFAYRGGIGVRGEGEAGVERIVDDVVVFEDGSAPLSFEATEPSRMLFGSAARHEHPLVLGSHSVHTSRESLARGQARILEVREELRRAGRL